MPKSTQKTLDNISTTSVIISPTLKNDCYHFYALTSCCVCCHYILAYSAICDTVKTAFSAYTSETYQAENHAK